jgi:hypothetical protein
MNSVNVISIASVTNLGVINPNALEQNESITIFNTSSNTGFTFTWLGLTTECPTNIVIRSHIQDGIFDQNGNFLNVYKEFKGKYKFEFIPQSKSNFLLEFRNLYPIDGNIQLESGDTLQISHSQNATTSRINKIIIKNLKTWH